MSKLYTFPFGCYNRTSGWSVEGRRYAMSVLSTSPALLLEASDWFYISSSYIVPC
jgi:hypothetical protein